LTQDQFALAKHRQTDRKFRGLMKIIPGYRLLTAFLNNHGYKKIPAGHNRSVCDAGVA